MHQLHALSALSDHPPECDLTDWRSGCAKLVWNEYDAFRAPIETNSVDIS